MELPPTWNLIPTKAVVGILIGITVYSLLISLAAFRLGMDAGKQVLPSPEREVSVQLVQTNPVVMATVSGHSYLLFSVGAVHDQSCPCFNK